MTSKQLFISLLLLSSNVPSMYGISSPPTKEEKERDLANFYLVNVNGEGEVTVFDPNFGQYTFPSEQSETIHPTANAESAHNQDNHSDDELEFYPTWGLDSDELPRLDNVSTLPDEHSEDNNNSNVVWPREDWELSGSESPNNTLPPSPKKSVSQDTSLSSHDQGTQTDEIPTANNLQMLNVPKPNSYLRKAIFCAGGTALATSIGIIAFRIVRSFWQQYHINKVLHKYGKNLATISSDQSKIIIAAYNNDHRTVHAWLDQHGTDALQHTRWIISAISDFYFRDELAKDTARSR